MNTKNAKMKKQPSKLSPRDTSALLICFD